LIEAPLASKRSTIAVFPCIPVTHETYADYRFLRNPEARMAVQWASEEKQERETHERKAQEEHLRAAEA
jgi:hypothetical protein